MVNTTLLMVLTLAAGGANPPSTSQPARPTSQPARQVRHVVVFDFTCKEKADYGKQLADSVRLRLRRHDEYKVIDRFTTAEMTPAGGISLKTAEKEIIALLKDNFAAHIAIFGSVQKIGPAIRAEIRCVDISGKAPVAWTKAFSDHTGRRRLWINSQPALPVLGVAIASGPLAGIDALLSNVQMPPGVPVGCTGIGAAGAVNAAVLAVEILSGSDTALAGKLKKYKSDLAGKTLAKNRKLPDQSGT